jgi:hypothetical protein
VNLSDSVPCGTKLRYRALTSTGDYSFGLGPQEFLVDTPATVAQAVLTALLLHQGEWFLDLTAGMPWETQVLGYGTQSLYDAAIKNEILNVQGVLSIVSYSSSLNKTTRALSVEVTINTIFGAASLAAQLAANLGGGYGIGPFAQIPYGGA